MELGKEDSNGANPWGRGVKESYDFDVTKSDKLFDFLLEKGQIKLPDGHVMLPPNQLTLPLIPLMNAELSGSIYRGLFSKEGLNLIRLGK